MADQPDPLAELKKIADMKFDRERHRLAAVHDELARLEAERKALQKQVVGLAQATESDPAAFINAYAYLNALAAKGKQIDAARQEAHQRTEAQREKIRTALASKIRVDGMRED